MNDVPYIVHESAMARQERTIRRWFIVCIIIFVAFIASNAAWIYYENQFVDTMEISQEVETGEGDAAVIGIGDYNSASKTDNQKDTNP